MRKIVLILFIGALLLSAVPGEEFLFESGVAYAQDDWRKEFDDVCSKTQDAMEYSPAELMNFIERCDALKPLIDKLDEPQRTVYLRRLKMCRDLYAFALEYKKNE